MVADLLQITAPPGAILGRLGGDEFGILAERMYYARDAMLLCEQILKNFNQPFQLEEYQVYITPSIGISFFPEDGQDPDTLIQNADTAMYNAKREGKNIYQFYNLEMKTQAQERYTLSAHLHHALELSEFSLMYHPILDIHTYKVSGSEALIRWKNPRLGAVMPDRFITLANETGLIVPIGEWILSTACQQARCWIDEGHSLTVNVNIAERQLKQKNFVEMITRILEETGLPAHLLKLELTENIFFQNFKDKQIDIILNQVKNLGVQLALDDFGTGYSTLSCLTQIPFDVIKIDRSLSSNAMTSSRDAGIVRGILNMAKDLGMQVVAEGIETVQQVKFYRDLNCDQLQGYYFCRPLPPTEVSRLISSDTGLKVD
jgi:predicted signal transduction protein with EAL and GGDEF domain